MPIDRRRFLETAAARRGLAGSRVQRGTAARRVRGGRAPAALPDVIRALKPMKDGVVPISDDERKARIAKAQKLMAEQKLDAIFMEGTTSCFYYTGMRWGQSERTFGVVIPANGAICLRVPRLRGGSRCAS